MNRITVVGHLNTFTGYGNHACETVRGFQKLGYAVSFRAIEISKAFGSKIPLEVQSCLVQKPQPEDWEILISTNKTAPTPGKKTLFYTMHESTVIDLVRVAGINQAEHIVVPCEWNRHVFIENGVTRPISVIPMGFDPKVFHDAPIGDLKRIVFGAAGRTKHGRQRKGLDLIVKSFREAFPTAKNVALKIKVFKDDEISEIDDPRIEVVRDFFTPRQIEQWLHSINVFVNVGAEAFGFWPLQALACGRPVVAPKYGGLQVLNPPDMELPFEETDAGDFFKGKWCSVKKEDLIGEMRRLFAHPTLIREAARQCRRRVDSLTWENSVKALAELYEDLASGKTVVTHRQPIERRTCIVQLGRFGDVLSIIPVAKAMYDRDGIKPAFMIQKEFASTLEGVSYVEPEIFEGEFGDVTAAVKIARQKYSEVVVPQVYGRDFVKIRDSYNVEAWASAGYMSVWSKLPLLFDRRDSAKEAVLLKNHATSKPFILFNGTGFSSPFDSAPQLLEDLRHRWGHIYEFIDLFEIKAERIFDLLGLYDAASGLISIDTATLHLAPASKVPFCALVSDRNSLWHGTRPRGNCQLAIRYSEVMERREEIHEFIESLAPQSSEDRLWHVYSDYPTSERDERRRRIAGQSWRNAYAGGEWRPMPILDKQLPRQFSDGKRHLVYVKDLLGFAAIHAKDDDWLVLTNSDICFSTRFGSELFKVKSNTAYVYRRDFKELTDVLAEKAIKTGQDYPGTDVFCVRRKWWIEHGAKFPDMLLGAEAWDPIMRLFMQEFDNPVVLKDLVYHERHDSIWERAENRYTLPSQLHNLRLANEYLDIRNIDSKQFGIRRVGNCDGAVR